MRMKDLEIFWPFHDEIFSPLNGIDRCISPEVEKDQVKMYPIFPPFPAEMIKQPTLTAIQVELVTTFHQEDHLIVSQVCSS